MKNKEIKKLQIEKHIKQLHHIFVIIPKTLAPEALYKRLCALEKSAHKLAEDQCNRQMGEGEVERREKLILDQLDKLIGFRAAKVPVFCNGDPRGYALKIEDDYVRAKDLNIHRDWGGYGIICPEF